MYTPRHGFQGKVKFVYRAFDGALSSAAITVTLTVQ
jgi:hypothetical protein